MLRRPPRSTRTDTLFPTRRSSDLVDDVAIVPIFILTPLTYLGGVFYSITLLHGWAQALTHANPIFYMVTAFRHGLLDPSVPPLWVAYALMLGFEVVLAALSLWLPRRGVGLASRRAARPQRGRSEERCVGNEGVGT